MFCAASVLSATPHLSHRNLVDRIEQLEAELASDIRDVYAEPKGAGFDVRAIRTTVRIRRQDAAERDERQRVIDEYLAALGDYGTTELGRAAIARVGGQMMPPV